MSLAGEVVVLIPSRNRPDMLRLACQSIAQSSDATVLAYIDSDQQALYEPLNDVSNLRMKVGPRGGPVGAVNHLCVMARDGRELSRFVPNARAWMYMTDDSTIGPAGWDHALLDMVERFPKRIGIISVPHGATNDYLNFAAMSTETIEQALGWFAPPSFKCWYWDTALEIIGESTRIAYPSPREMNINHIYAPTIDSTSVPDDDLREFHRWAIAERRRTVENFRKAMG